MQRLKNIKATAIITAILIVAVVSIAAITMQGYLTGEMNRTKLVLDNDWLLNKAYDIEAWGLGTLKQAATQEKLHDKDKKFNFTKSDFDLNQSGKITYQNGIFNINYLFNLEACKGRVSEKEKEKDEDIIILIFKNLLRQCEANNIASENEIDKIITEIQQWGCPSQGKSANIDNDNGNEWSYQKSGQLFTDKSELRLVPGVTKEIYNKIAKFITVFPTILSANKSKLNINISDISVELFAAIVDTDISTAKDFLDQIKQQDNEQQLNAIMDMLQKKEIYSKEQRNKIKTDILSTQPSSDTPEYFIIESRATRGDYISQIQSLVKVTKSQIDIVWRKQGLYNE